MTLEEVLCYKSSVVLGEEVWLGQLTRWDLSLLSCLSHPALRCASGHERCWCHSLIEGQVPPSAYSSHLGRPGRHPLTSPAGFIFCGCCQNVNAGREAFTTVCLNLFSLVSGLNEGEKSIQILGKGGPVSRTGCKKTAQKKKKLVNLRRFRYQSQIPSSDGENLFSAWSICCIPAPPQTPSKN